jgi:hypothetical protein
MPVMPLHILLAVLNRLLPIRALAFNHYTTSTTCWVCFLTPGFAVPVSAVSISTAAFGFRIL